MWQRKQTVFLLVAAVLGLVYMIAWPLFVLQVLASSVSVVAIFLYKRRPTQASVCLAATFVNMAWYVAFAVLIHNGTLSESLPMAACLPIIAAILCFLARRAVIADEKLVRSADRIR